MSRRSHLFRIGVCPANAEPTSARQVPPLPAVLGLLLWTSVAVGQTPIAGPPTAPEPLTAAEATAAAEGMKAEPRHALIVGVSDYEDPRIPDLPVCKADARAVHALLTNRKIGGVPPTNATLLIDEAASQRAVERALNALRAVPRNATVFVYFSGHGARVGEETFLIPQDAEAEFFSGTSISQTDLDRYLKRVPAARVVQFVDACFAAGLRSGPDGTTKAFAADAEAALASFTGRGRIFFGAAGADEEALTAPDKKRSVFTLHLLDALKGKADANSDGVVTAFEVAGYLDGSVSAEAAERGGLHRPRVEIPAADTPAG
ncbi:caspase domain-containing protein [Alienimonas sp. DA493]|uniref:caspase family protein n=1 Tax=Alienimonas sp. DA493 TaxID=3373605 RepID=UPI0037545484